MATVQGLYIALFGRPADPLGLAYFKAATLNGANLSAMPPLDKSSEYRSLFAGQTIPEIVNAISQSLFNRDAEPQTLTALADAVATGTLSINKLAITLIDGARGNDLTVLSTKLAAADAFTAAVDTAAEIAGYSGMAAAKVGRSFLASVDTTAPLKSTLDNAVLRATGTDEIVLLIDKPLASAVVLAMPLGLGASDAVLEWTSFSQDTGELTFADGTGETGGTEAFAPTMPTLMGGVLTDTFWFA